jgi:hypothetical protein
MRPGARMMTPSRWIVLGLTLASLGQLAWYLPRMPAAMATHYDAAGLPNGFMAPGTALGVHLFILGVLALGFVVLPALLGKFAVGLINIPNRGYWLSPERRAASLAALRTRMEILGCAALALMLAVGECSFHANLNPPARLPTWPLLCSVGAFLSFMAAWMLALIRRFPRPRT